jgi:hypothetical protein
MPSKKAPPNNAPNARSTVDKPKRKVTSKKAVDNSPGDNVIQITGPGKTQNQSTENSKSDIKNLESEMEVHHHPEVEKKGLKEYLLEGLMIFLAVFMGFIAENLREDYTEHKKAQEYAITMAADLISDTSQLKNYLGYYKLAKRNTDTLMKLMANTDIKKVSTGKLYLYGLWAGGQIIFKSNDATFQQMKSTGALQFFKRRIAREAGEYDRWCRYMQSLDEMDEAIYVEVRKMRSQVFEFQYNTKANDLWTQIAPHYIYSTKKADIASRDSFININPPLLTYNKSILNQYVELARSRYMMRKIKIADSVLAHGTKLLSDIKKEYNVEE